MQTKKARAVIAARIDPEAIERLRARALARGVRLRVLVREILERAARRAA